MLIFRGVFNLIKLKSKNLHPISEPNQKINQKGKNSCRVGKKKRRR